MITDLTLFSHRQHLEETVTMIYMSGHGIAQCMNLQLYRDQVLNSWNSIQSGAEDFGHLEGRIVDGDNAEPL